jgi:hypothetical protein
MTAQRPAFCGPLRTRRLETAWNGSPEAQLALGPLTPGVQSPEYARGLGRDRFAFRRDRFAVALRDLSRPPNDVGRTDYVLGRRRRLLDQAKPSCFSWSAETVGRLRTSRVTLRLAGPLPSAIASMMRGRCRVYRTKYGRQGVG